MTLPRVARVGGDAPGLDDVVVGTPCSLERRTSAEHEPAVWLAFDRYSQWADAVGQVHDAGSEGPYVIAARGLFGIQGFTVEPVRPSRDKPRTKVEAEQATCWGPTLTPAPGGWFVSKVRRARDGGERRRTCCFDPDMDARAQALLGTPVPLRGSRALQCDHEPLSPAEALRVLDAWPQTPKTCDFTVLSLGGTTLWTDVAFALEHIDHRRILLENAGSYPCPDSIGAAPSTSRAGPSWGQRTRAR